MTACEGFLTVVKNGRVLFPENCFSGDLIFNDKILSFSDTQNPPRQISGRIKRFIDASGFLVSPGFIDIHIHGSNGYDVMDCTEEAIEGVSGSLVKSGVTSFLPATMSASREKMTSVLKLLRSYITQRSDSLYGARVLGVHLEGPFLNPERAGAQKRSELCLPDYSFIEEFRDIIKIVTLAPELPGSRSFLEKLTKNGIIPSIGHSDATYEEAVEAINLGIRGATHLCNGMSVFEHRKPGIVGAALDKSIYCEVIADLVHVHPAMLRLISRLVGRDRLILITDAMRGAMLVDGVYELGGQSARVKNGVARLMDGTLAGSVLSLNAAVFNMISCECLSLVEAIRAVSFTPASYLGIEAFYGSLLPGRFADVLLIDPEKFDILATFINGVPVFMSEKIKDRIHDI